MQANVVPEDHAFRDQLQQQVAAELSNRPVPLQQAVTERLLHTAAEVGVNDTVLLVLVQHEGTANAMRYLYLRLADRLAADPELHASKSVGAAAE